MLQYCNVMESLKKHPLVEFLEKEGKKITFDIDNQG